VDEDGFARQLGEARANRIRPLGAALDQLPNVQAAERRRGQKLLPFPDHHAHRLHRWMTDERLDGPAKDGFSAEKAVLLGNIAAGAFTFPGGDNERCSGHGAGL
jgi:hypothetical protein